jgi:hypothetical protein
MLLFWYSVTLIPQLLTFDDCDHEITTFKNCVSSESSVSPSFSLRFPAEYVKFWRAPLFKIMRPGYKLLRRLQHCDCQWLQFKWLLWIQDIFVKHIFYISVLTLSRIEQQNKKLRSYSTLFCTEFRRDFQQCSSTSTVICLYVLRPYITLPWTNNFPRILENSVNQTGFSPCFKNAGCYFWP